MNDDELDLEALEGVVAGFSSNVEAMEVQKEKSEEQLEKTSDSNERQALMTQINDLEEQIQSLKGRNR